MHRQQFDLLFLYISGSRNHLFDIDLSNIWCRFLGWFNEGWGLIYSMSRRPSRRLVLDDGGEILELKFDLLLLNTSCFRFGRILLTLLNTYTWVVRYVFWDLHEGPLLLGWLVWCQGLNVVVFRIALTITWENSICVCLGKALVVVNWGRNLADAPSLLYFGESKFLLVKYVFCVSRDNAADSFFGDNILLCLNTILTLIGLLIWLVVHFSALRFMVLGWVVLVKLFESLHLFLVQE